MTAHVFSFHDATIHALPSGALWLAEARALVVSDLHLGKADRIARREGRLTPPYEVAETLGRLADLIGALHPATVICLGDSFDDNRAATDLADAARAMLAAMMAGRRWIWIAGNHDPMPQGVGGTLRAEHREGPLLFRHIAATGAVAEISGHYHPKAWLQGRGRPAFLMDANRIIMPAFGTYTGGMDVCDPVFDGLMAADALALMTGRKVIAAPRTGLVGAASRRRGTPMRGGVHAPVRTGV